MKTAAQIDALYRYFAEHPDDEYFGLELGEAINTASGTLYPALATLEHRGHLESYWETLPDGAGRRPRRVYRLTGPGYLRARQEQSITAPSAAVTGEGG